MCRSWQELSNESLLAKFGFDTAKNEPDFKLTKSFKIFLPSRDLMLPYVFHPGLFRAFRILGLAAANPHFERQACRPKPFCALHEFPSKGKVCDSRMLALTAFGDENA